MTRRRVLAATALTALLAASLPATANSNKLLNPLFTTGVTSWALYPDASCQVFWSANGGTFDPGALLVAANGTQSVNRIVAQQTVNVHPGTTYSIGGYFWFSADSATYPVAAIGVSWFTGLGGTGDFIGSLATPPTSTANPGTWIPLQKTVQAPANAKSATLFLGFTTTESKTALALFDFPFFSGGTIGDVNGDGVFDVSDVFYLINDLFANGPLPVGVADENGDYKVDVSDVFYLINYLFSNGNPPVE
jgi:hypothetical protein